METKEGWELNVIYGPGTDPVLGGRYNYKEHNWVNWKNQGMEVGFDKKVLYQCAISWGWQLHWGYSCF